jgi:hypothetical protein
MKPLHLSVLLISSFLLLLVSRPPMMERQSEESPLFIEDLDQRHFKVRLEITDPNEQEIADILWFQEAARAALERKITRFNVVEQNISEDVVEGVIQLETDPMKAEYDAQEILSLTLSEENQ